MTYKIPLYPLILPTKFQSLKLYCEIIVKYTMYRYCNDYRHFLSEGTAFVDLISQQGNGFRS
jgi:hypothetical protein